MTYSATQTGSGPSGPFNFTAATVVSPSEVTFTGDGGNDQDTFIFAHSLALGGTDAIIGALFNGSNATGGGSVSGPLAVPETTTWVMALVGFGLIGGVLRKRTVTGVLSYVAV